MIVRLHPAGCFGPIAAILRAVAKVQPIRRPEGRRQYRRVTGLTFKQRQQVPVVSVSTIRAAPKR